MASNKNMLIESVSPMFFDADAIRIPTHQLFRIYTPRGRYYYTVDLENNAVQIYIGVTTMIGALVPKGEGLVRWMADMGYDQAKVYSTIRAQYGTLMHNEFARFLIEGVYDMDALSERVYQYISEKCEHKQLINAEEWINDMVNDLLAFAQFCYDYQVQPIAIEIMLPHPDGYAGTIDLLCYMTIKEKIDPSKKATSNNISTKRVLAAVDFKSGRKGFYDEYAIQLESYRSLVQNEWPDLVVEKIFNWSPKEWRTTPGYNLKDQSEAVDAQKFSLLVEMAKIELMKIPSSFLKPHGIIKLREENEGVMVQTDIIQYILDHHRRRMESESFIDVISNGEAHGTAETAPELFA